MDFLVLFVFINRVFDLATSALFISSSSRLEFMIIEDKSMYTNSFTVVVEIIAVSIVGDGA